VNVKPGGMQRNQQALKGSNSFPWQTHLCDKHIFEKIAKDV
jgi:hypothetical protein